MGVPLSYYFQLPLVRAKLTLGDYLSRIGGVLEEPELTMRLVVTCIVCGLIGAAIGRAIRHL